LCEECAECRRRTGKLVVSVRCYMACSEWRVLSVGKQKEQ
jgi:hypothetical protein